MSSAFISPETNGIITTNGSFPFSPNGMSSTVNLRNDGMGPVTVQIQMGSTRVLANYNDPKTLNPGDTAQQVIPEAYHRGVLVVTANTGSLVADFTC